MKCFFLYFANRNQLVSDHSRPGLGFWANAFTPRLWVNVFASLQLSLFGDPLCRIAEDTVRGIGNSLLVLIEFDLSSRSLADQVILSPEVFSNPSEWEDQVNLPPSIQQAWSYKGPPEQ
ncbi:hypothetical protein TEA_018911 [Camellia sinensis var. sinensis]|uniref:Uncharacterized protein n=1 Tax=Camellia sinensis var. sinensis TaxID=542762 RepID=A0A4V3WNY8_CAMSN|nr:hypothetical protein TEA_018911 [Camellia sinensis var. sinensis]